MCQVCRTQPKLVGLLVVGLLIIVGFFAYSNHQSFQGAIDDLGIKAAAAKDGGAKEAGGAAAARLAAKGLGGAAADDAAAAAAGGGAADPLALTAKVFFDVSIAGTPAGRIEMGLFGNTVPKTAGQSHKLTHHCGHAARRQQHWPASLTCRCLLSHLHCCLSCFVRVLCRLPENFRALCTGERGAKLHFKGSPFHRIIPSVETRLGTPRRRRATTEEQSELRQSTN